MKDMIDNSSTVVKQLSRYVIKALKKWGMSEYNILKFQEFLARENLLQTANDDIGLFKEFIHWHTLFDIEHPDLKQEPKILKVAGAHQSALGSLSKGLLKKVMKFLPLIDQKKTFLLWKQENLVKPGQITFTEFKFSALGEQGVTKEQLEARIEERQHGRMLIKFFYEESSKEVAEFLSLHSSYTDFTVTKNINDKLLYIATKFDIPEVAKQLVEKGANISDDIKIVFEWGMSEYQKQKFQTFLIDEQLLLKAKENIAVFKDFIHSHRVINIPKPATKNKINSLKVAGVKSPFSSLPEGVLNELMQFLSIKDSKKIGLFLKQENRVNFLNSWQINFREFKLAAITETRRTKKQLEAKLEPKQREAKINGEKLKKLFEKAPHSKKVAEFFSQHSNIDFTFAFTEDDKREFLIIAANDLNRVIVKLLAQQGAKITLLDLQLGFERNVKMLQLLVEEDVVPHYLRLMGNLQPLHIAADTGDTNFLKMTLEKGADPDAISDHATALDLAVFGGHTDVAKLLLAAGANPDCNGMALYVASSEGYTDVVKLLLAAGANPNDHDTALYAASLWGHTDVVKLLLAAGANPNRISDDDTALYAASSKGYTDIVQLLLAAGANPNISGKNGTPLLIAVERKDLDNVKLLIDNKAYIGMRIENGEVILDDTIINAARKNLEGVPKYSLSSKEFSIFKLIWNHRNPEQEEGLMLSQIDSNVQSDEQQEGAREYVSDNELAVLIDNTLNLATNRNVANNDHNADTLQDNNESMGLQEPPMTSEGHAHTSDVIGQESAL